MIDEGVFRDEWTVLCERFGKDRSRLIARRYFEYLTERLTTEEFVAAAKHLFAAREFFPRPVDFVSAAGADQRDALRDWELCQAVMEGGRDALLQMSDEGQRVARLLGGREKLRMTRVDKIDFVRRDFLALYRAGDELPPDRLPPMSEGARKLVAVT